MYIYVKRCAKESDLDTGDQVLVKKERKIEIPSPYKLVDKHGNSCMVE